jgi:hypothetical protein
MKVDTNQLLVEVSDNSNSSLRTCYDTKRECAYKRKHFLLISGMFELFCVTFIVIISRCGPGELQLMGVPVNSHGHVQHSCRRH